MEANWCYTCFSVLSEDRPREQTNQHATLPVLNQCDPVDLSLILCLMFQVDLGGGLKPPGFYVQRSCGLFPAPFPQDSEELERITKLFHFLGVLLAKCIQDNRLVDLPVSQPFFKLLCMGDIKSNMSKLLYQSRSLPQGHEPERAHLQPFLLLSEVQSEASTEESQETYSVGSFDEDSKSEFIMDPPKPKPPAWYHGILTWDDFHLVNPHR